MTKYSFRYSRNGGVNKHRLKIVLRPRLTSAMASTSLTLPVPVRLQISTACGIQLIVMPGFCHRDSDFRVHPS